MAVDETLVRKLRQILPEILDGTPVKLAYLHGSSAVGQALPTSDVDIALVLWQEDRSALSPREQLQLEFAVERALEQQDIQRPDVRIIDHLPLTFRGQVATQGVIV